MCRLYGFLATHATKVECSLVHAQNALLIQSQRDARGLPNSDGWGIAYFDNSLPTIEKYATAAYADLHFSSTAERVYSKTVIAHVRRRTVGRPTEANSHPFGYRTWVFAHNGTVAGFKEMEPELAGEVVEELSLQRKGTTDSELAFYWLLTRLLGRPLEGVASADFHDVTEAFRASVRELAERSEKTNAGGSPELNFLLTDGKRLWASRWNRELSWLDRRGVKDCEICGIPHLQRAPDREYRAIVIASEPITSEEWDEVPEQHIVAVDEHLQAEILPV